MPDSPYENQSQWMSFLPTFDVNDSLFLVFYGCHGRRGIAGFLQKVKILNKTVKTVMTVTST